MEYPLKFHKVEGCGNNFVILPYQEWLASPAVVRALLDRDFGISADGLILIHSPASREDVTLTMINPDGSAMGMCGNGVRCALWVLANHSELQNDELCVVFDVQGRKVRCSTADRGANVLVEMGVAEVAPEKVPVAADNAVVDTEVLGPGGAIKVSCVSMGNPHCITQVADVTEIPLESWGPWFENNALFPERVNFSVVQQIEKNVIRQRVWERGAGETKACGTAACAAVVAGVLMDRWGPECEVQLPGGKLRVTVEKNSLDVIMQGPARAVFEGFLAEDFISELKKLH